MSSYPELVIPRCFLERLAAVLLCSAMVLHGQAAPAGQSGTAESGTETLQAQVWDAMQAGDESRTSTAARQLLAADPDNSLGLAALVTVEPNAQALSLAKRGLRNADRLRCASAMSEGQCARLRTDVLARLNAAAGRAYLERKDHITARRYLNNAIALAPAHPQYVYAAALANLEGKNPRPDVGYRLLARAVHLTQSTPGGNKIEQFARERYIADGGSSEDWDAHLAAARPSGSVGTVSPAAPAGENPSASSRDEKPASISETQPTVSVEIGTSTPAPLPEEEEKNEQAIARADQDAPPAAAGPTRSTPPEAQQKERDVAEAEPTPPDPPRPSGTQVAKNTPPKLFPELAEPMPAIEPGAPVSLGIVIQSSVGGQSKSIAGALSSLVRQMREEDEAFVISFSNGIVFEQDFTGNYRLLEQALESVEPQPGTALMESLGFAAIHLARVGRNDERVLLLISDGKDAPAQELDPRVVENIEASGARIFCIGVGVESADRRDRLTRLASATGGAAVFISGGNQFYAAADRVAQALHIGENAEGTRR